MNDHLFCRELLKQTMVDVRKVFSPEEIRRAWAWGDGRTGGYRSFEFHGPNGEYESNIRGNLSLFSRYSCIWTLRHC